MRSGDVLSKILDATREGVLVAGSELRVTAANNAAYRYFSSGHPPIEGQTVEAISGSQDVAKAFTSAIDQGRTSDIHLKYIRNGTRRFDVHVAPLELEGESWRSAFFTM